MKNRVMAHRCYNVNRFGFIALEKNNNGFCAIKKCVFVFATIIAMLFSFTACANEGVDISSLPSQKKIDVENMLISEHEFPKGSSLISATIILRYNDLNVRIFELYDLMVKSGDKKISPSEAFLGDPMDTGFGCYSPVVEKMLNRYFNENAITNYQVVDLSGNSIYELYGEIANGNPIIVWAVYNMEKNPEIIEIPLDNGEICKWTSGTYCTVLIGYDIEEDTVTLSDPYEGIVTYSREDFELAYDRVGRQALMVTKTE